MCRAKLLSVHKTVPSMVCARGMHDVLHGKSQSFAREGAMFWWCAGHCSAALVHGRVLYLWWVPCSICAQRGPLCCFCMGECSVSSAHGWGSGTVCAQKGAIHGLCTAGRNTACRAVYFNRSLCCFLCLARFHGRIPRDTAWAISKCPPPPQNSARSPQRDHHRVNEAGLRENSPSALFAVCGTSAYSTSSLQRDTLLSRLLLFGQSPCTIRRSLC